MVVGSACIPSSCGGRCSSYRSRGGVFEWPRCRAADERDELAPPHGAYPKAKDLELKYSRSGPCIAAKAARLCPLWVRSRLGNVRRLCPLCPRKRTCVGLGGALSL